MKIVHTSDWHLGKRLEGKSRLEEQRAALDELVALCEREHVDVVLAAGDLFDTSHPPAEAEELFYSTALRLAQDRFFVAVAGNHDNAERLSAPAGIASVCNIILVGGMDNARYTRTGSQGRVTGGTGWVRIERGGETLNLALLPYPSPSRMSTLGYPAGESYAGDVADWLQTCCRGFTDDGINLIVSHLFLQNVQRSDEYELGTAALLPLSVLPPADYTALGHVHKPQKVSGKKKVYYSGSLLRYSFDDTAPKAFYLLDCAPGKTEVTPVPIAAGKPPVRVTVNSFAEATQALSRHGGDWVQILYDSPVPLSSAKVAELRGFDNFCNLISVFRAEKRTGDTVRRTRTDKELFAEYYRREKGEEPPAALTDLFLRALSGEEL